MRRWLIGIVLVLAVAGGLPLLTLGAGGGPLLQPADYLDPGLCWTGCKNTGRGGALSKLGYLYLTRAKSYHLKRA